jgi:hypothetical protein
MQQHASLPQLYLTDSWWKLELDTLAEVHVRKYRAKTGAVLASFFIRLVYVVRRYRVTVSLALEKPAACWA